MTLLLTGLGVPLALQDEKAGAALDALPSAKQDELIAAGFAEPKDPDVTDRRERSLQALSSWSGTYHWERIFEPSRDLVEHPYMPSVGSSVATVLETEADYPDEVKAMRERYCVDDAFMWAVNRRAAERRSATRTRISHSPS